MTKKFELYRLFSDSSNKYYLGVTSQNNNVRLAGHKHYYRHPEKGLRYSSSKIFEDSENINDVKIECLCKAYDKGELHFIERDLIKSCKHDTNMVNIYCRK